MLFSRAPRVLASLYYKLSIVCILDGALMKLVAKLVNLVGIKAKLLRGI